ncbi:PKD domain-containing protein, partial [Candidatus Woesearchaeota archaeon]|nr:PKD domain-containing protein [Candidatus Woesearchaeota archaeon]
GRVDAAKAFAAVADSQAPVANAGNNTSINLGQEINLNGSLSFDIDGSITSYEWDLGDGSSASGAVVTHTYLLPGNYTVTLTVTDNDGLSDQDTAIVEVSSFQQLFFDNFESGNLISNWIETGMLNWNVESPAEKPVPSSFSNLVAHADKCTSNCILTMKDSLNLSNYKSIRLRFKRYVDNDLDNGEFLAIQASNGGAWLTIFSWAHNSGDDDTWHEVVVARDISTLTVDKFKLRFISKESTDKEDTEIDDVKIEAEHK